MVAATATALDYTRALCPTCHGTGESAALTPLCGQCGASWTPAHLDWWIECYDRGYGGWLSWLTFGGRNRYRWDKLPCLHSMTMLRYRAPRCRTCRGVGTIARFTLADTLADRLHIDTTTTRMCLLPKRRHENVSGRHHYPPVAPMSSQRTTPRLTIHSRRVW